MTARRRGRSALLTPLRLALALLILFEEWGWDPLQRWMSRLAQGPVLRRVEAWVGQLPPYAALAVFLVPGVLLLPVKLGAMWLLAHGQGVVGLALIVAAKVVGTAMAARLFTLTRPALLSLPWFAQLFERWTGWKTALLAWVRGSPLWLELQRWSQRVRSALARLIRR